MISQQAATALISNGNRLASLLRHRSFMFAAVAAGILLSLPSLSVGWLFDDYYQRWILVGSPKYPDIAEPPLEMFSFAENSQRIQRMKEIGIFPWWTSPDFRALFLRPITALTHWIDYKLWPNWPQLMHAQSLAWFGLLLVSTGMLYRRMMRWSVAAGLATLLYCLDYAHAVPADWLANRNSVLATLFGVLSISAHIRWRTEGRSRYGFLALGCLTLSLLSAEAGIATCAYLLAYQLTCDRGTFWKRFGKLMLYAVAVVVWRVAWNWHGSMAFIGGDWYVDPLKDPVHFIWLLIWRTPLLVVGQWALPPAEIHFMLGPQGLFWMWLEGIVLAAILAAAMMPLLKRSRVARFWALGSLLSILPAAAAPPMSRTLTFVGIGAMGLLAQYLAAAMDGRFWWNLSTFVRGWRAALIGALVLVHLVIAPVGLYVMSRYVLAPNEVLINCHTIPNVTANESQRDLIIVNHPVPLDMMALLVQRAVDDQPLPRHVQVLAPACSRLTIERLDAKTLLVRSDPEFFALPSAQIFYLPEYLSHVGKSISLPPLTATIEQLAGDRQPTAVLFRFDIPLEDASLHWIYWNAGEFREFVPPKIGERVELPDAGVPF
jgi:hypothetical protein